MSQIRSNRRARSTALPTNDIEQLYYIAKEAEGWSLKSLIWAKNGLKDVRRFLDKTGRSDVSLVDVTYPILVAWLADLRSRDDYYGRGKKLTKNTVNCYWRAVKRFYDWLYDDVKVIDDLPTEAIKTPKSCRRLIPTFQEHHIQALLQQCPPGDWYGTRDRAIIFTLLYTGLRKEEIASLTLDNINFEEHYIRVIGKGDKQRQVHLQARPTKEIIRWLTIRPQRKAKTLFTTRGGNPLSADAFHQLIVRIGQIAGVKDVRCSCHTFRHTFGLNLLREGHDIRFVQAVMGHESLNSTEIYVRQLKQEDALAWHSQVKPFKNWRI